MHGTPLGHLGQTSALRIVEIASDHYGGSNSLDPSVGALVAVFAVIGVNSVERQ